MLELKNVTKRFSKFKAVDDFSFKFEENVYALLGPNGAGKTTLLRCLTNLYPLDGGEINFNGVSINKKGDLPNIGYLPQTLRPVQRA